MFRNHFKSIDSSFGPLYIDLISWEQFGMSSTLINQRVTCVFFWCLWGSKGGQQKLPWMYCRVGSRSDSMDDGHIWSCCDKIVSPEKWSPFDV